MVFVYGELKSMPKKKIPQPGLFDAIQVVETSKPKKVATVVVVGWKDGEERFHEWTPEDRANIVRTTSHNLGYTTAVYSDEEYWKKWYAKEFSLGHYP